MAAGRVRSRPGPASARARRSKRPRPGRAVRCRHEHQRGGGAGGVDRHRRRPPIATARAGPRQVGREGDGLGHHGRERRRPGAAARRPAWGPGTRRRPGHGPSSSATMAASTPEASGPPSPSAVAQLAPARGHHGRLELGPPAPRRRAWRRPRARAGPTTWATESRSACCSGEKPDVHQSAARAPASAGVHSSRSVRRSTLPDGSRGMSSTTTTCRSCL